jgi:hypothetical protein
MGLFVQIAAHRFSPFPWVPLLCGILTWREGFFSKLLVEVQEVVAEPIAPSTLYGEWRQDFRHTYIALATNNNVNPPYSFTYICASYPGHLNWVTDPPPAVVCPIPDLLPKPTDACSVALEAGFGTPSPASACQRAAVLDDPAGEPCLRRKLGEIGIAYNAPTSTYRTDGYQNHLSDLWYKYQNHTRYINKPDIYQACATRRAIVVAEQYGPPEPGHGLGYEPLGSSHEGNAFDISGVTIDALKLAVPSVNAFLATATADSPACNLNWGGDFTRSLPDKFHFYTPPVN